MKSILENLCPGNEPWWWEGGPRTLKHKHRIFDDFFLKTQYDFCRWAKQVMLIGKFFEGGLTEQPCLSFPGLWLKMLPEMDSRGSVRTRVLPPLSVAYTLPERKVWGVSSLGRWVHRRGYVARAPSAPSGNSRWDISPLGRGLSLPLKKRPLPSALCVNLHWICKVICH